ncbi:reverse transcriptase [Phytophthora cinnamomi]|uniref:reverse transcriptase n=1 Tax=Phytophthora cinnamomi TaxID=4785 RepID=UPI00355A8BDB|nr:reverse transcriptase [Phytophthora cinnamomi]
MRESDIPLTAVNTPSSMLWEWLVMPQGFKNAPATFTRFVTHLLRSVRDFAPSYFDDVFIHSRAVDGKTDVEMHRVHLRKLLELVKELRQFLGLATYLCKYVEDYAGKIRPLSQLLKKEAVWNWTTDCQTAFDAVKRGLTESPILAVAAQDRPFHVVCDASDFAIGCALMQHDHEGRDRVVYYQSRQLKPAERNYPVHDKELLAMKYALAKFRVYLLGSRPFVVYTDHASLRTAVKSPHISQRMARWLSFFAEYNFRVEYKPGRLNVVADALSRRPDYSEAADVNAIDAMRTSTPTSSLLDDVKAAYAHDADAKLCWPMAQRLLTSPVRSCPSTFVRVHTAFVCTTDYCFIMQSTTTRIALSCQMTMTCDSGSCTSIMMPRLRDISGVRRLTSFSRATSTGTTSISGYASTSVLARYANA